MNPDNDATKCGDLAGVTPVDEFPFASELHPSG
jgi:hypothetical protein